MKLISCVTLTAALALFSSLGNARGAPPSSFVPRSSHEPRATLNHKHSKAGHYGTRRNHYTPRTLPSK
jgi:hypothetical protein